jgi:hypothetical protein
MRSGVFAEPRVLQPSSWCVIPPLRTACVCFLTLVSVVHDIGIGRDDTSSSEGC